jgi:hypothetical protein
MSDRAAASRFPARPISSSDLVAGGNRCRHVKKPIALLRLLKGTEHGAQSVHGRELIPVIERRQRLGRTAFLAVFDCADLAGRDRRK